MSNREIFTDLEHQAWVKGIAEEVMSLNRQMHFGRVEAYDAKTHAVKVRLLPQLGEDADITGFIPLMSPWVGKGWGMQAAPKAGEAHAVVVMLGNPVTAMFAVQLNFNAVGLPPEEGLLPGEMVVQHSTGTRVRFHDDSQWELTHPAGARVTVKANSDVEIDTPANIDITAAGNIGVDAGGNVDINAGKNATLKAGGSIDVDASGKTTIKGSTIDLN